MWNKIWTVSKYILFFVPLVLFFLLLRRNGGSNGGGVQPDTKGADVIRDGIEDSKRDSVIIIEHTNNAINAIQQARSILDGARQRTKG